MQLIVNIVVLAAIYALIACGYVLIYRVSRVLNLAHGELMMLGAYLLLTTASAFSGNAFFAIVAAIVLSLLVGVLIYVFLMRKMAGEMVRLLDDFSKSLAAFYLDNLQGLDRITVVVMSEFGRRIEENASLGLDHGHGNCMLFLGGGIHGGQVIADWPGLAPPNRDEGDLKITIDCRDLLSEILFKRFANDQLDQVFPGYAPIFRGLAR